MSATEMALIFAGCILAIGGIVILWRRGVLAPKPTVSAPSADEAAK